MKIKEVALNEIHWTIDQWNRGDQANDRLSEKLGPLSRYFAKGNVGAETFTWSFDAPLKWTPLNKASEPEAVMARQRWEELKNEVKAKLADTPDLAEHILEIPNEDYIHCRTDETGATDILITGWGFRNFKKAGPHIWGHQKEADKSHPVDISFILEGEKQPSRPFFIVAPKTRNEFTTDAEGNFRIGNKMEPGVTINVVDGPTQKTFQIVVDETQTEYVFDVTQWVNVNVSATHDGQPVSGSQAKLNYRGKDYDVPLQQGQGDVQLALAEGEICTVRFAGEEQAKELSPEGDTFIFDTFTPMATVNVQAVLDGQPVNEGTVRLNYDGNDYDLKLSEGKASIELPLTEGQTCTASFAEQQQQAVLTTDGHTFVFDQNTPPELFRVTVLDADGKPIGNQALTLSQGDNVQQLQLDDNGSAEVERRLFDATQPIKAKVIPAAPAAPTAEGKPAEAPATPEPVDVEFTLEEGENEYVLQQRGPEGGGNNGSWLVALLIIAALAGIAYACYLGIDELKPLIYKNILR